MLPFRPTYICLLPMRNAHVLQPRRHHNSGTSKPQRYVERTTHIPTCVRRLTHIPTCTKRIPRIPTCAKLGIYPYLTAHCPPTPNTGH